MHVVRLPLDAKLRWSLTIARERPITIADDEAARIRAALEAPVDERPQAERAPQTDPATIKPWSIRPLPAHGHRRKVED